MIDIAWLHKFKDGMLAIIDLDNCYTLCSINDCGEIKSIEHFTGYTKGTWTLNEVIEEVNIAFRSEIEENKLF